jgi:hypothetical protein
MHRLDDQGVPFPPEERERLQRDDLARANYYGSLLRKLADMPHMKPSDVLRRIADKVGWKPDPWGDVESDALITLLEDLNKRGL